MSLKCHPDFNFYLGYLFDANSRKDQSSLKVYFYQIPRIIGESLTVALYHGHQIVFKLCGNKFSHHLELIFAPLICMFKKAELPDV